MRRTVSTAAVVVMMAFAAAGCAGAQASDTTLPPLRPVEELALAVQVSVGPDATVEWADYPATLQSTIDSMAQQRDCRGLEAMRAREMADNPVALNRTGHTNAKLIHYIREQFMNAGCVRVR